MNDVSNRAVREFSEFLNSIEADFPKPTCTTAYEITIKSTIVSALITLDTEKQMDERFWNHLRVQRNILDFLYALWLDDDRTLVDEFSTIIKDLVEYDFYIAEEQMKEIQNYKTLDRHFAQRYTDRFQEGEMRKRIQFMYGGELQTIRFEYTGPSLESVLDRLPTAKVLQVTEKGWLIEAEVFGTGIQMWIRSQGDYVKVL